MVLTGVSVMFFFQALTTFTEYFAEAEAVKSAMFWMVGDIGKARWEDFRFIVPITAILVPILIWKSWDLNIIGAGDESAKSLGINVKKNSGYLLWWSRHFWLQELSVLSEQ